VFEFVSNWFGGSQPQTPAPAPAPAAAPAVAPAPAPTQDHAPAPAATPGAPAAAADPHADAAKPKPVDQKAMADAANTIFKKMDGLWVSGSDRSTILDTLRGKTPDEVAAIKASYAEHFPGHNMDADIGKNMSGKDLAEAKASMSGDPVAAAVASIKNAETGTWLGNVDADKVQKVLSDIKDPEIRKQVSAKIGGEVSSMQSGDDKKMTDALLKGDTATASAIKIDQAQHSWTATLAGGINQGVFGGLLGKDFGVDKDAIYKAIEDCKDPKQREAMVAQYKVQTNGADLSKDLDKVMDGANRDVATKLLEGDPAAANAARLKASTEHWFTDKDALYKTMEGKSDADRKQMIADYNKMYGKESAQHGNDVDAMLKDNLSGLDLEKAKQLEDKGKMDDTFALKYAMEGSFWSTDKQLIKDTLAGKSPKEIQDLETKFAKANPGKDLQTELRQETSGRDGFEIQELMKGEPQNIDDKMARARERYDFERGSGSNFMSKAIVDTFSDKGELLDAQQARMEELYKQIKSGHGTQEQKDLLDRVTGYQNLDTKNYQESKDAVTNGAVAVAAITASTVATVLTGGAAAPAEVAIIAALAGGTATIVTKSIIQDSGYSNEELRNDIIMTGVNMATGGLMGAAGEAGGPLFNAAEKLSDNPIAQQAFIQGVSGAVSSGVGNATQTMLAGGDMKDILKSGAMGGLTGGVGGAVTGGLGAGLKGNKMFEGMDPVKAAMLRNAIAGGAGAVASTAIDPDSYKGDSAALMMKWGSAVGGAVVGGIGGGYNEGKEEVKTAKTVESEEQRVAKTGEKEPTPVQKEAIAEREMLAENPAELHQVENVEKELEQGKFPKMPVEDSPGAPLGDTIDQAHVVGPDGKITTERSGGTRNELGGTEPLEHGVPTVAGTSKAEEPITPQKIISLEEPEIVPQKIISIDDPLAEPKQWAKEQQKIAEAQPKLTADQEKVVQEVAALKEKATSHEQWEEIRAREAKADIPVTERTSLNDDIAALDAMKKSTDYGKHSDGSPVTKEEHEAALKELRPDAEKAAEQRAKEHAELVDSVRADAEATYQKRDKALLEKVAGQDKIVVDEGTIGLGLAGTSSAAANPKTTQVDEHGMPRNLGLGQDAKPELLSSLPADGEFGQPAQNLNKGLPGLADMAEHPTAQNTRVGEAAAAVAENRAKSGLTSLEVAGPLSPLEVQAVRDEHGKLVSLGAISTSAEVQVGVDEHGLPITERKVIEMRTGVDFAGGMGPSRELDVIPQGKGQLTKADAEALKGSTALDAATAKLRSGEITREQYDEQVTRIKNTRVLMSAEDALALPPEVFKGQDVLVVGGGPTAKWAGDHALGPDHPLASTASSVEIAGKMPRPPEGSEQAKKLLKVEAEIQKALADPATTPERMAELKEAHHDIVRKHIASEMADLKGLQAEAAKGALSPADQERLTTLKNDLDPFLGSRLDRNIDSLKDPLIGHMQMDIARVEQVDGKARVTYVDGTVKTYDRVIPGIGANAMAEGGVGQMMSKLPTDLKFVPVIENGHPVGLMSDPPGITISGAAALGGTGKLPPTLVSRMDPEHYKAYVAAVQEYANREGVSHGSKGVVPGIENAGENPASMQAAKARTPEERQQMLEDWLAGRATQQAADVDVAITQPAVQPKEAGASE
jgi:hypothetical protein